MIVNTLQAMSYMYNNKLQIVNALSEMQNKEDLYLKECDRMPFSHNYCDIIIVTYLFFIYSL